MKKTGLIVASSSMRKSVGVPKTAREKYDKLKLKNKNLELLSDTFGLELNL